MAHRSSIPAALALAWLAVAAPARADIAAVQRDPGMVGGLDAYLLEVAPGTTREVSASGVVRAPQRFVPDTWFAAVETRHLLLDREVGGRESGFFDLRYLLAPLRTWAGARDVTVVVRRPAAWAGPGGRSTIFLGPVFACEASMFHRAVISDLPK